MKYQGQSLFNEVVVCYGETSLGSLNFEKKSSIEKETCYTDVQAFLRTSCPIFAKISILKVIVI